MYKPYEMYPSDHGLPLVQLKERRREMVVALQNRTGSVTDDELRKLAAIQQAISAFEDVIADLDCEQIGTSHAPSTNGFIHSRPSGAAVRNHLASVITDGSTSRATLIG